MAKGRMLQNRISKSKKLSSLSSDTVRLLYTWTLSHLDVNGNFYADPVMVNNLVFTRLNHSAKTIGAALDELASAGLIIRYRIDGEDYLNYPDFQEKQPALNPSREGTPDIPEMTPELILSNAGDSPGEVKLSKEKLIHAQMTEEFNIFWKAYPKKKSKREAEMKWRTKKHPPLDEILSILEKHKKSADWQKEDGRFIPYASTWLNQERWEDEPDVPIGQQPTPKIVTAPEGFDAG